MTIATQYERYMLELINAERAKVGAPALQLEQNLNAAADAHSDWMLDVDIFSHTGVNGSSPTKRIRDAQFDLSGGWRTAENIAVQSERGAAGIMDDVANLHTSLMNSPGHRANILNPDLDYIGIGIALGDFDFDSGTYESVIVTQNFASTGGSVDLDTGEVAQPQIIAPVPDALVVEFVAETPSAVQDLPAPEAEAPTPTPVAQTPTPIAQTPSTPSALEPATPQVATPATPAQTPAASLSGQLDGAGMDLFDFLVRDTNTTNDGPIFVATGLSQADIAQEAASLTKDAFRTTLNAFELELQQAANLDLDTVAV